MWTWLDAASFVDLKGIDDVATLACDRQRHVGRVASEATLDCDISSTNILVNVQLSVISFSLTLLLLYQLCVHFIIKLLRLEWICYDKWQ